MGDEEFWSIIQDCHVASGGEMGRKDQLIKAAICRLSGREAAEFYEIFNRTMDAAYTWGLWGAAYVINGGCGDDTFDDFRASLISRGQVAFQKAIIDPDSLADEEICPTSWFHEGFEYAVAAGVQEILGTRPKRSKPLPGIPAGKEWAEATVRDNYPKLARRFEPS